METYLAIVYERREDEHTCIKRVYGIREENMEKARQKAHWIKEDNERQYIEVLYWASVFTFTLLEEVF